MARITIPLLKKEFQKWNNNIKDVKKDFGSYMNKKYHFKDPYLEQSLDIKRAHAYIYNNHVQKTGEVWYSKSSSND